MDWCERHRWYIVTVTDLAITDAGPSRLACMAAIRRSMRISPRGARALVNMLGRGMVVILREPADIEAAERELGAAGATTERIARSYCPQRLPGDPVDDGAIA